MMKIRTNKWLLCVSALVVVTLFQVIPGGGAFYASHVYPFLGSVLSRVSGLLPFAMGDLFIAVSIVGVMAYPLYALCRGQHSAKVVMGRVVRYLLWVYVWFYLAWGLNYSQPDVYQRIGMQPAEVSAKELKAFACRYADSLNATYMPIRRIDEGATRMAVADGLCRLGSGRGYGRLGLNAPFNPHPHAKTMTFSWLSSMAGVTGSMGPFFCEFTLNGDLQPHEYPATYAHEYAHFLGIADEGEANFYSYLICTSSADRATRFSGYYQIFFHVLANVRHILGEKEGKAFLQRVRPEIIRMAKEDREYWIALRSPLVDSVQDVLFEFYLKGNKVKEGRKSYSGVVALVLAWQRAMRRSSCA